jgi:hypothetical protein
MAVPIDRRPVLHVESQVILAADQHRLRVLGDVDELAAGRIGG